MHWRLLDQSTMLIGSGGYRSLATLTCRKRHGAYRAPKNAMLPWLSAVFPNAEMLRIATSDNCAVFAQSGKRDLYRAAPLGVLREGASADMLLVRGKPLDDLHLLEDYQRNLLAIIEDGVIHKSLVPATPA